MIDSRAMAGHTQDKPEASYNRRKQGSAQIKIHRTQLKEIPMAKDGTI